MIGTRFFKLYNQLLSEATHIDTVIADFVEHLIDVDDQLIFGYGATIKNGVMNSVTRQNSAHTMPSFFSMTVKDVSRRLFDLEDHYISTTGHINGTPFLSEESAISLSNSLSIINGQDETLVNLLFYCDGLLKSVVMLVYPENYTMSELELSERLFLRSSIEAIIYKIIRQKENSSINHLLIAGETIIKSSQFKTSDSLERILNLAFELSGECDYGSCLLFDKGFWTFTHTIGHDYELLKDIHLPGEIYLNRVTHWSGRQEVAPNIYWVPQASYIQNSDAFEHFKEINEHIINVSLPIKETLQLHIYFGNILKAVISLDIKEGSHRSFSTKSISVLKRIGFLGQIVFTNASMLTKSDSFEGLTELMTRMIGSSQDIQFDFLNDYLKLMVDSIYEASYASAYIRDNKGIHFLATVGHDLEGLQALDLKPEYFVSREAIEKYKTPFVDRKGNAKTVSATLFSDLFGHAKMEMPEAIYAGFTKASLPVKDALISQANLADDAYMYISCDIKADSPLFFSKESIQLFSALNNLGFSFISNQHYITQYKNLNADLEDKIVERTLALEISNSKLQDIADKDSMTGLLNHNTIIKRLETLIKAEPDVSIFLFDIDHFKKVNDTYGHPVGDRVLIGISDLIKNKKDIVAGRYGGEEFLIIMPGFNRETAVDYCQSLLHTIAGTNFINDKTITVSGGVVTRKIGNATELIHAADTLLYEAKNAGRNRLFFAHR